MSPFLQNWSMIMKNSILLRSVLLALVLCSGASQAIATRCCGCAPSQATGGIICLSNLQRSKQTLLTLAAGVGTLWMLHTQTSPETRREIAIKGGGGLAAAALAYWAYSYFQTEAASVSSEVPDELVNE